MDAWDKIKNHSFDVQLFFVLLLLLFTSALLGQKFIFFHTMTLPLLSLLGSLYVWFYVKNKNKVRKAIGISFIIILLCGTIFEGIPGSHNIGRFAMFPLILLLIWEFTQISRNDTKFLVGWLFLIPMFALSIAEGVFHESQEWVYLLLFPVIWIFMSLYANASVFKKAVLCVGLILVTLLVSIFLAIDFISLGYINGFINELIKDPSIKEFFGSIQSVPLLQMILTGFFLPFIVTSLICYFIADKRVNSIPAE